MGAPLSSFTDEFGDDARSEVAPVFDSGDFSTNTNVAVDGELVLFSGVTGKLGKRGILPSANGITLLGHSFPQMRTDLGLVIGTDVQAALGFTAVPNTRTINGHALSSNVTLSLGDIGAQAELGFTPENTANKVATFSSPTDVQYPTAKLVSDQLDLKVSSTESSTVDGQVALFNGTGGKIIRKSTATGIAKLSSGVLSAVAAPTGNLVGHDDTQIIYNKTLALTTVADVGLNFVRPAGAGVIQLLAQDGASSLFSYLPSVSGTLITAGEVASAYQLALGFTPVPNTVTVNGHALSGNVTVTPTDLGLVIGTNVQAYDADLTTWAGLTPSANAQSLVTAANYAAMKALLGLTIGTNVQAWNAHLDTWAAKVPYAGELTITSGKSVNITNNLTFVGTDGSQLNIGAGGTLGSNAFNSTAYEPALGNPGTNGFMLASTTGGTRSWIAAGNALTSNPLSQFAATTSAQLAGVISDETGSGSLVFADNAILTTPTLGDAQATSLLVSGGIGVQIDTSDNPAVILASNSAASGQGGQILFKKSTSTKAVIQLSSQLLSNTSNDLVIKPTVGGIKFYANSALGGYLYPSGGWALGSTPPADPGAGNLTVQGSVTSIGGVFTGNGSGLTNVGITNSAGATVIPVSDGTNLIASSISDNAFTNADTVTCGYGLNKISLDGSVGVSSFGDVDSGNGRIAIESGIGEMRLESAVFKFNTKAVDFGNGGTVLYAGGVGSVTADTGWTANSDSGDKTKVIGSAATLAAIATALDIVTSGAGTQLKNIGEKVKALEAALTAALIPNA